MTKTDRTSILLPEDIVESIPDWCGQKDADMDAIAHVRYFHPTFPWTFFATEYNGKNLLYGYYVNILCEGWGCVSLAFMAHRSKLNNEFIERDEDFKPTKLATAIKEYKRSMGITR